MVKQVNKKEKFQQQKLKINFQFFIPKNFKITGRHNNNTRHLLRGISYTLYIYI